MAIRIHLLITFCLTLLAVQSQAREELRIAVSPDTGSTTAVMDLRPLIAYLGQNMDVDVVPVADANTLITGMAAGAIDLAWIDGYSLLLLRRLDPRSRALVQRPQDQQSRSLIVTAREDIWHLGDLRGTRFAFGSVHSASGWLMPSELLRQQGISPGEFFARIMVAPHGDLALRWLAQGHSDAAVVDLQYWQRLKRSSQGSGQLRVVARSEPYTNRSWSVRGGLAPSRVSAIQSALLALDPQRPRDRQILQALEAERYVPAQPGPDPLLVQAERLVGRLK